jgi:hypothetical protein
VATGVLAVVIATTPPPGLGWADGVGVVLAVVVAADVLELLLLERLPELQPTVSVSAAPRAATLRREEE